MRDKSFLTLIILAGLFTVLTAGFTSAISQNITLTTITNGTVESTSNASTIAIGFKIFNVTTLAGANVSYSLDDAEWVTLCNSSAGSNAPSLAVGEANGTCTNIGGNKDQATENYIHLNLSEGKHVLIVNVTLDGATSYFSTINDTTGGGNDTFIINNFDSLAFGAGTLADGANLSATSFLVNVTFNTKALMNITFALYNQTVTPVLYNTTGSILGADGNGSELGSIEWNSTGLAYHTWGVTSSSALPNLWYTYNVTLQDNETGYNYSITRTIRLDTIAPNISFSTSSCTGWKSETDKTVEKDSTLTCSCSVVDENDTSVTASYNPSSTPPTSSKGLFGVVCSAEDSAGNNGTSVRLTYTVVGGGSSTSGGGGGGGASPSIAEITGKKFVVSEEQFVAPEGQTAKLSANDGFVIDFKPSSSESKQKHTVKIVEIKENSAVIIIASEPIQFEIEIGETKKVDVDGDRTYDIEVTLNSIEDGKGEFTVKETSGTVPEGESSVSGVPSSPSTPESNEGEKGVSTGAWIAGIVIAIAIILIILSIAKKKK